MIAPIVVKVGGSLYDLPDFGSRLQRWLEGLLDDPVLLVPGGGQLVDVLRDLDRKHCLGEDTSHELALRMLAVNAHFLAALVQRGVVVDLLLACSAVWDRHGIPILDCYTFLCAEGERDTNLPHSWDATSDSIAAYVARRAGARRLVLLKSTDDPTNGDWIEAARLGIIDPWFARIVGRDVSVEVVNLRHWPAHATGPPTHSQGE
jgi:aspartokinase-like uncharacterized kinase